MPMRHVLDVVPAGGASYPVLCGEDAASALGAIWQPRWRQVALVGDDTTLGLFGDGLGGALRQLGCEVVTLGFAPGEAHKTRATKERLEDGMLAAGLDRQGCVVAVGGGIVLDVAGFVAATYLRGIDHVAIATTLLAQVDAAVGGKTGVNTLAGKNLVGAFHHPRAVLLDTGALATLAPVELRSGLAEAIKHAVLRDQALFATIERWAASEAASTLRPADEIIMRALALKTEVVAADDRDRGLRQVLNFGHTVGHAIEHATGHAVPHGHAVAIGMVVEAALATAAGIFPPADLARLRALLRRLDLPTAPPCSFASARAALAVDKKTAARVVHCAIPTRIGLTEPVTRTPTAAWVRPVALALLEAAWEAACSA